MKQNSPTSVPAAFKLLLEEVEDEIEFVNEAGARAFAEGNYERVEAARWHAVELSAYRGKLGDLRQEWESLSSAFDAEANAEEAEKAARRDLGRLKRGMRMPEDAYRRPILQALVKMGGSGKVREVLTYVEEVMRDQLTEADYQTLPSTPNTARWYNTAQWARNSMVNEGLMRSDSPRGLWQIGDEGRAYLKSEKAKL